MEAARMDISNIDMSTPFTKMVDEDIQKCEALLNDSYNEAEWKRLHIELTAKYASHLADIGSDMYEFFFKGNFFDVDSMGENALRHNLFVLKNKLTAFKNFGYRSKIHTTSGNGIEIQNNLTATQTQTINITFEDVRRQIEEMTGLSEGETQETLTKIDEIKAIVELKEPKKTKWQKIKPILTWLADKNVDVGIALLPLIMKIGG